MTEIGASWGPAGRATTRGKQWNRHPTGRQPYEGHDRQFSTHEAAAAAGQARANSNEMQDIHLERLIAASGFGHIHIMNVLAKPHHHHMLQSECLGDA
jgi:hypothetical protein